MSFPKPKLKWSCKFPQCENKYYSPSNSNIKTIRFHRFPRDNQGRKKWQAVCQIENSVNCDNFYVCDDHFKQDHYINHLRQRVKYNAVPSLSNKVLIGNSPDPSKIVADTESLNIIDNHSYVLLREKNNNENSNFNLKNHQQTRLSYSQANDASNETFTKNIPLFENIDPSNQAPNLSNDLKCNPEKANCPDSYSEKTSSNNVFNDETETIPISDKLFIDLGTILTSSNTAGEET